LARKLDRLVTKKPSRKIPGFVTKPEWLEIAKKHEEDYQSQLQAIAEDIMMEELKIDPFDEDAGGGFMFRALPRIVKTTLKLKAVNGALHYKERMQVFQKVYERRTPSRCLLYRFNVELRPELVSIYGVELVEKEFSGKVTSRAPRSR